MQTLRAAIHSLISRPQDHLLKRWNWKSAVYSSLCRASLFFAANIGGGWRAALGAMTVEFVYRAVTAGFYGSLTQSFHAVRPKWHGTAAAVVLLVGVSHSIEFVIHYLRGTPNLGASITASVCFTLVSTLFNLHAMRSGVFVIGHGAHSLIADFRMLPRVVASFVMQPFRNET